MVFYPNPVRVGLDKVRSLGEGSTINLSWFQAYPTIPSNLIAYNIYFSTIKENVFTEGPKFVSIDNLNDGYALQANIKDLIPGQMYWFSIRPLEYNPTQFNLASTLPLAYDNLRLYPNSLLRSDITATDLTIPLLDTFGFPSSGVVKIGEELILYAAVDSSNNLIVNGTAFQSAHLVDLGGGNFYQPSSSNIGSGTINSLTLVDPNPIPQTWTIRCVFVREDSMGNPIQGSGNFIVIGSISGDIRDIYGEPFVWLDDGIVNSNGVLKFSISDSSTPLRAGDSFIVKVAGSIPGVNGRGYNGTVALGHTVGGFDGYNTWDPTVSFFAGEDSTQFDRIFACQNRFEYPNYSFSLIDGYKQQSIDILSTDLSAADADNVNFTPFDFSGFHRTDPVQLLNGTCVGSYIGGYTGCIDGYGNVNIIRGLSLEDVNTQRQDVLLSITGVPACLIQRVQTGIVCNCYISSSEYPDDRCPNCFGTKFVIGWNQYFNPRRADGRIMVRPGPTAENLRMRTEGLESEFPVDFWTLTVPTIKSRDVLILFDQDNNESFRYEVGDVIRNDTILGLNGGQHLKTFRVRKTDVIYQIRAFRDTSMFPEKINTSVSFVPGIPPHSHVITRNEHDPSTWSQTTQVAAGHNHPVLIQGGKPVVVEELGHSHEIILI